MLTAILAAAALASFSPTSDNPHFPVQPGMRWVYEGREGGARLREVVRVRRQVEHVTGIPCAIVEDRLYEDGRLAEATTDWYAQDAGGRVWYFGEDTRELDDKGRTKTTEGSWRAGIGGAKPGIVMPARLKVGRSYRQERFPGHAEDHFRILDLDTTVSVPAGTYPHALKTGEWNPLEPGVRDRKWYAEGVGLVKEETIRGGDERLELVSFTK